MYIFQQEEGYTIFLAIESFTPPPRPRRKPKDIGKDFFSLFHSQVYFPTYVTTRTSIQEIIFILIK